MLKGKNKVRRVKTIYDCQADNDDELTFIEGEVIVVTGEEDQEWWVGISGPSVPSPNTFWAGSVRGPADPAVSRSTPVHREPASCWPLTPGLLHQIPSVPVACCFRTGSRSLPRVESSRGVTQRAGRCRHLQIFQVQS